MEEEKNIAEETLKKIKEDNIRPYPKWCFACKNYSKAYIRFLLKENEPVGKELASYHNLHYLIDLIEQAKQAIKKGKFKEFKERVKRVYNQ